MKIVVIISGGIAAYKALDVIRGLKKSSHSIKCILTKNAEKFVTPLSVSSLSGEKAYTNDDFFIESFTHIKILDGVELIVVVPASANIIAKAAHGFVDELASLILLIQKIPIIMIPAMNSNMWLSMQVLANVSTLKSYGVTFMDPCHGTLACGSTGLGRLPEPADIISFINQFKKSAK